MRHVYLPSSLVKVVWKYHSRNKVWSVQPMAGLGMFRSRQFFRLDAPLHLSRGRDPALLAPHSLLRLHTAATFEDFSLDHFSLLNPAFSPSLPQEMGRSFLRCPWAKTIRWAATSRARYHLLPVDDPQSSIRLDCASSARGFCLRMLAAAAFSAVYITSSRQYHSRVI